MTKIATRQTFGEAADMSSRGLLVRFVPNADILPYVA